MNLNSYVRTLALGALIILGGCTRLERNVSKFNISLPSQKTLTSKSVSAQAVTGILGKVIINVRGAGIQVPISLSFDAKGDDGNPQTLPDSFSIEVPSGSARLIQILAVYVDTSTENAEFFYGDTNLDLTGGEVNVTIPIVSTGAGNVKGGKISGRYFAADGSTPTGFLESRYQPPAGKPPMVIERSSMLRGWFSAFALDSVPLDVVLAPQEEKLFTGFTLNSLSFTDNKKIKVNIPKAHRYYGGSGSGEDRNGESAILGFFGPGVPGAAKVCYTQATYTFTTLFTESSRATPIQWSDSLTGPSYVSTQKDASVGVCTAGELLLSYVSVLPFNPTFINNWGGSDAVAGFSGVFTFPTDQTNGSSPVRVAYDGSNQLQIQLSVLNGIPVVADSIGIFYRPLNSPRDYDRSHEAPCVAIANGAFGFRPAGSIPLVLGTQDYSVTRPAPSDANANSVFAFCPLRGGVPLGGGFINSHISSGPGGGASAPANSFMAYAMNNIGTNQCHKVSISLVNESGGGTTWNVTNSSSRNFTVTSAAGHGFYENEATCSGGTSPITSFVVPANMVNGEVWIKTESSPTNDTITIQSPSSFGAAVTRSLGVNISAPSAPVIARANRDKLYMPPNGCEFIEIMSYDSAGVTAPVTSPTTINLSKFDLSNPVSDNNFNFYTDCSSGTAITSVTLNTNTFKTGFAVKTSATPPSDRKIRLSGLGSTPDIFLNITPQAHHLATAFPNGNNIYVGSCVPVNIRAEDISNNLISAATFQFDIHTYPNHVGEFKHGCSTPANGPFTLATGTYGLTYLANTPANNQYVEANSVFAGIVQPQMFNVLPVPAFARGSNLKVHLTSDVLAPNLSSVTSWQIPNAAGITTSPLSSSTMVTTTTAPKNDGAIFNDVTAIMQGGISIGSSSDFAMTVRFKVTTARGAEILSLRNSGSTQWTSVSNGDNHSCGITNSGELRCWGNNSNFQVGDGTSANKLSPVAINAGTNFLSVAAGGSHTCAIDTTNALKCWGYGGLNQLGTGSTANQSVPVVIDSGVTYSKVAAGTMHTCGITTSGVLKCWGTNTDGQIGDGTTTTKSTPVVVDSGVSYSQISVGNQHTCGITISGVLKCWGRNIYGQVGDNTTTSRTSPVVIDPGTSYAQVSAGNGSTCAVTTSSSLLKCWGYNVAGQLGDGTNTDKLSPTVIDSGTSYSSVALGSSYSTCGITVTGALKCWGDNSQGQLGKGVVGGTHKTPVLVDVGNLYSEIKMGTNHTCALSNSLGINCWGQSSSGQLGQGNTTNQLMPVPVQNFDARLFTFFDGTNLYLRGPNGWQFGPPLALNTWYTVTLENQSNNINGYVNGTGAGGTTGFPVPPGAYTVFEVGRGLIGAVKAIIIDAAPSGGSPVGSSDHSYILQRVP